MYSLYSLSKCLVSLHILTILLLIHRASSLNLTNEYIHHNCRMASNTHLMVRIPIPSPSYFNVAVTLTSPSAPHVMPPPSPGCPRNKGGTIWYDQCFLDVSMINEHAPRLMNYENIYTMHSPNNMKGDTNSFNKKTTDFLHNLIVKADTTDVDGINFLYYAAGELRLGKKTLYGMVQCAKDIRSCKGCLEWSIRQLSKCCDGKQGGRVLTTSCNLRYELYPFLRT
ncbi:hypothetical protein CARUB_v10015870mg [Capsella rubella]|uniref:Gnk2-homologous domain-containing protein n=1 Tax=Capsella rubella TaxID=81985 RepID=R0I3R7_9BRAS|nr:hypothetical protein CARUB_v10015870mg [Capsella rubella]